MTTEFLRLNDGWNAEPGDPDPTITVANTELVLSFYMNHRLFPDFREGDLGKIIFNNCSRYRLGLTNDEGWYQGQCRFSSLAPAWGEFYEIRGDLRLIECPDDWVKVGEPSQTNKHYLFYFKDETFECDADGWFFVCGRLDH